MTTPYNRDVPRPLPLRWPPSPSKGPPPSSSLYAYVLDADEDLAEEIDIRERVAVRQRATARVLEPEPGDCDLARLASCAEGGIGLLVLAGVLAVESEVSGRTALELIGPGDLLQAAGDRSDELLARCERCRVLGPAQLAVLDSDFAMRVRPWPEMHEALLRRLGRRLGDLDALRAITAQPRLEVRLSLLLWHLATRWGKVEPAGIRVTLPLTHRLLGQLVSAERPSISHALHRLAAAQLVTGTADDLHLHGTVQDHLAALLGRAAVPQSEFGTLGHRSHQQVL